MSKKNKVADMRADYRFRTLEYEQANPNPILQFEVWFQEAIDNDVREANAMTLATCTVEGKPSARTVLLKGFDESGFVFYTNYNSRKGHELISNPHAALVFCWLQQERQVRIEGKVEKLSEEASTAYFQSRPKGSQIGAWASPQSQIIENRVILEKNVQNLEEKHSEVEILPRPPHWGGFRVVPQVIEFWQGRSSRLHDRLQYEKWEDGTWKIVRLAP